MVCPQGFELCGISGKNQVVNLRKRITMTERSQNILIYGFLLILLCAVGFALNKCADQFPDAGKVIVRDTIKEVTQLPPERDTVTATLTVVRKSRTTDTLTIVKIDSFFRDLPPFSLRGAEFITSKRDTITAQYNYPANQFEYVARYAPDTVLTVTTREYIQPNKLQFGAQIGAGIAVGIDGVMRPAVFVGVGLNWRL